MIVPDLIKAVEAGQEKARLEIQGKHRMNERIKQLAEQAGLKQRLWNSLGKELPMWQEDANNPGLEKFAELIVKECMEVALRHTPDTEECEYSWLIHDKIKQHFGVEE
jgi:hypothetical protein